MMQPDGACENDYFSVPSTAQSTYLPNLTIFMALTAKGNQ